MTIDGRQRDGRRGRHRRRRSRTSTGTCSASPTMRPTTMPPRRSRPRSGRRRCGGHCRSPSGRRSSCGPPTCWPARGGTRSTRATMLGQSKTCYQAEIDSACELIDFLRFNVHFGQKLLADQPHSSPGVWNRFDHRPLEGFVVAITPFNFTAIAGNLPTAPALMGNTVVWKPSVTAAVRRAPHHAAARGGRPAARRHQPGDRRRPGGQRGRRSPTPTSPGCTSPARPRRSSTSGARIGRATSTRYRSYPRIVGETGGKDFVIAHPSADADALHTALIRGAFEYQGQKCSAASRAYVPRSLWEGGLRDRLAATADGLTYGDVDRLHQLRRRGHRPARLRQARRGARPHQELRRLHRARRRHVRRLARATSCGRPWSSAPTRRTRCSPPSTSARSSACTSSTTTRSRRPSRRPRARRRTA